MYCNIEGGKKIGMPRYYKDKIYTETERERIAFFARLKADELLAKHEAEMYARFGDDWIRCEVEVHKRMFEKMYKDAERGRNKI